MAATKILAFWETLIPVTISFASIANGAGRVSDVIDNTTLRAREGRVYVRIKSGASAPTANLVYKVYLVRRSSGSPDIADDSLGTADAGVSAEPIHCECLGSIVLTATANFTFAQSFEMDRLTPEFSICLWNASGQTVSTTGGDHAVQVVLVNPELQ